MKTIAINDVKVDEVIEVKQNNSTFRGLVTDITPYGLSGKDFTFNLYDIATKYITSRFVRSIDSIVSSGIPSDLSVLKEAIKKLKLDNVQWKGGTLGADPEVFVLNSKSGQVIPAFNFLKSNKEPDLTLENMPIFWDGFQAEFNLSAGGCLDGRVASMWHGLRTLSSLATKHDKDAILTIQSTVDIAPSLFDNAKPEHIAFGCSPSLNVYGMSGLKIDGAAVPFRSAGGHIHFGIEDSFKKDIVPYVKALDKILGVACVSLFHKYDNPARRTLYGLAGEYRTPAHGFEYRTLSNGWVCHPTIMYIVNELARKAIGMEQNNLMEFWNATEEETIECINNCDVGLARTILARNEGTFKKILMSMCYQRPDTVTVVYNTFMLGMEELVNPETIEDNWAFSDSNKIYNTRIHNLQTHNSNYTRLLNIKI